MRARVAALMRIAQAIKRGKAAYEADGVFVGFASPAAVADVFESCVIPHAVASDSEWRSEALQLALGQSRRAASSWEPRADSSDDEL